MYTALNRFFACPGRENLCTHRMYCAPSCFVSYISNTFCHCILQLAMNRRYSANELAKIVNEWSSGDEDDSDCDSNVDDDNDCKRDSDDESDLEDNSSSEDDDNASIQGRSTSRGRGAAQAFAGFGRGQPQSSASVQPGALSGQSAMWQPLVRTLVGRACASNVFTATKGVGNAFTRSIQDGVYSAWKCFITEAMLRKICEHTQEHGQQTDATWSLTLDKLEAYIALIYARGLYGKCHPVEFLWNTTYGPRIFSETMSRNDYKVISRYLRFDHKQTRSCRVQHDTFTHIRELFDIFAGNCLRVYVPGFSLTVDEQLLPSKNRCPFIVFMPNKPDKFGMKFWMLADVETKYVVNILPYLGAVEKPNRRGRRLSEDVVNRLAEPVFNKGYNLTMDNFFTSVALAKQLYAKKNNYCRHCATRC